MQLHTDVKIQADGVAYGSQALDPLVWCTVFADPIRLPLLGRKDPLHAVQPSSFRLIQRLTQPSTSCSSAGLMSARLASCEGRIRFPELVWG